MDINASEEIWNFVSKYDLNGLINCNSTGITPQNQTVFKNCISIIDILGRERSNNGIQLHIYDDGSVEKKHIIK